MVQEAVTAEIAQGEEHLAQSHDLYLRTQAIWDDLETRERKAWGPRTRGTPKSPKEWEKVSHTMEREFPRILAATVEWDRAGTRLKRLRHPYEVTVRVELARERMKA